VEAWNYSHPMAAAHTRRADRSTSTMQDNTDLIQILRQQQNIFSVANPLSLQA
jgi:hypothetical protein